MRDKLIELIIDGFRNCTRPNGEYAELIREDFVDYLISHGVTLAEGVPLTNGDRIRAMSDEELGNWLCSIMENCDEKCPGRNWCKTGHKGTVAWLKQPAEEVDHETC